MFKPMRVDANGTGDALTAARMTPAALQIGNENRFASVELPLEFFWCDPRQPKLAYKAMPAHQPATEVNTESS
jgi:hypothetical protein